MFTLNGESAEFCPSFVTPCDPWFVIKWAAVDRSIMRIIGPAIEALAST